MEYLKPRLLLNDNDTDSSIIEAILNQNILDEIIEKARGEEGSEKKIWTIIAGKVSVMKKRLEKLEALKRQKLEQNFNSYLWALSTYAIHFFLEQGYIGRFIAEKFLNISLEHGEDSPKANSEVLKSPYEIKYESTIFTQDSPPVRNYILIYHLPNNVSGDNPAIENLSNYDCCNECDCKGSVTRDNCFIKSYGTQLRVLTEGVFEEKGEAIEPPDIKTRRNKEIATLDLSSWKGELCIIESEATLVCNKQMKISLHGRELIYNDYWSCLFLGLGFITDGKTNAQVIQRMLIESSMDFREIGYASEKKLADQAFLPNILNFLKEKYFRRKDAKRLQKKISDISHLLNKARVTLSPTMLARAPFARNKFKKYIEATGGDTILQSIENGYNGLNSALTRHLEFNTQRLIVILTYVIVFMTFFTFATSFWIHK